MQPYGVGDKKRYTADAARECKDSAVSRAERQSERMEKAISGTSGKKVSRRVEISSVVVVD